MSTLIVQSIPFGFRKYGVDYITPTNVWPWSNYFDLSNILSSSVNQVQEHIPQRLKKSKGITYIKICDHTVRG